MARGYQTPMERKRMSRSKPADDSESPTPSPSDEGEQDDSSASSESGNGDAGEALTQFLPKEFFGNHECKVGDVYQIRVKAIDPETGEKEVEFVPPKGDSYKPPGESPSVSGMDNMMGGES